MTDTGVRTLSTPEGIAKGTDLGSYLTGTVADMLNTLRTKMTDLGDAAILDGGAARIYRDETLPHWTAPGSGVFARFHEELVKLQKAIAEVNSNTQIAGGNSGVPR
jgi:hypothetical protein